MNPTQFAESAASELSPQQQRLLGEVVRRMNPGDQEDVLRQVLNNLRDNPDRDERVRLVRSLRHVGAMSVRDEIITNLRGIVETDSDCQVVIEAIESLVWLVYAEDRDDDLEWLRSIRDDVLERHSVYAEVIETSLDFLTLKVSRSNAG